MLVVLYVLEASVSLGAVYKNASIIVHHPIYVAKKDNINRDWHGMYIV